MPVEGERFQNAIAERSYAISSAPGPRIGSDQLDAIMATVVAARRR